MTSSNHLPELGYPIIVKIGKFKAILEWTKISRRRGSGKVVYTAAGEIPEGSGERTRGRGDTETRGRAE